MENNLKARITKKAPKLIPDSRSLLFKRESRSGERFENLSLDSLSVNECNLTDCVFKNIEASSTSFGGGKIQSVYTDCIFQQCRFAMFAVGNARFVRCRFESCHLEKIFGTKLELIDCEFPGTTIKKSVFHGTAKSSVPGDTMRARNEFRGNDFSGAKFIDVGFRGGIDLNDQKLPQGDEYLFIADTTRALEIAEGILLSVVTEQERKRCQEIIGLLTIYCSTGQRSQLLQISQWGGIEQELRKRLS